MLITFLLITITPIIIIFYFAMNSSEKTLSNTGNKIENILLNYSIFLHQENLVKQADIINEQLHSIKNQVQIIQTVADDLFSNPIIQKNYKLSLTKENDGYYWEQIKGDYSNAGVSANINLSKNVINNLIVSKSLEGVFRRFLNQDSRVASIYYIGPQSYWRAYPNANVKSEVNNKYFNPKIDITKLPFYPSKNSNFKDAKWTRPLIDLTHRKKVFSLSLPIYKNNNEFAGALVTDITISQVVNHFLNFHFKEPTAYAILLDSNYDLIASQKKADNDLKYLTNDLKQKLYNSEKPMFININNEKKIVLVSGVKETNWKIAYVIPKNEIISHVRYVMESQLQEYIKSFSLQFIGLICLVISILVFVTIAIWKHFTKPILELLKGISSISDEKFQVKIKDQSLEEFQLLSQSFNLMANKMNDLISKYQSLNIQLEEKVLERTKQLSIVNGSLQETNEKLKSMEQARKIMFSNIAHDIKTPLTIVLGYIDAIEDRMIDSEKIDEYLARIQKHLHSIDQLVKSVSELNNVELNEQVFHYEMVDSNEYFIQISEVFVHEKTIHFKIADDLPFIFMDHKYIERAILNLIENAKKYSYQNSPIEINVFEDKEYVVVSVRDYGWGIAEDYLPFIFDRFYRVDHARNSSIQGNGVGLAIVKEIVNAHGGFIEVQSKLNVGSEFMIYLPVNKNIQFKEVVL
ncbi:sensor histidine kinase [Gottfriedia luciferensis]|uniref:sensor histidine kinase n=1 Tax=Gottfriedia luciferensis TaxID=178774 RepID=UPI0013028DA4|nr:ATP-binding protein [Gottfriedia luciferensis]